MSTTAQTELIPVLDLRADEGRDPTSDEALAGQLCHALKEVGFFFVVNHGIDWSLVESVYAEASRLHAEPAERLSLIPMDRDHGGYLGLGGGTSYASEIAGEVRTPNLNAAYFSHRGGYRLGNRWPDLDGFRPTVDRYMDAVTALADACCRCWLSRSTCRTTTSSLTSMIRRAPCVCRTTRCSTTASTIGAWPPTPTHRSSPSGRQRRARVGDSASRPRLDHAPGPTPVVPGQQRRHAEAMDQPPFRSTAHRARNQSTTDRYAIPFFYRRPRRCPDRSLANLRRRRQPGPNEPITYGDYQRWFINRNYANVTGETSNRGSTVTPDPHSDAGETGATQAERRARGIDVMGTLAGSRPWGSRREAMEQRHGPLGILRRRPRAGQPLVPAPVVAPRPEPDRRDLPATIGATAELAATSRVRSTMA